MTTQIRAIALIEGREAMADADRRMLSMYADGRYLTKPKGQYRSAPSQDRIERLREAGYITVDDAGTITVTAEGAVAVNRWKGSRLL